MTSTTLPLDTTAPTTEAKRGLMYWMFIAMVFLYPVWPVFIEKKFGPLPSLTPQKILTYALVGLCLLQLAFSRPFERALSKHIAANKDIFKLLALLFTCKFASCIFGMAPFQSFGFLYYEVLTSLGLLFITLCLINNPRDLKPVFTAMLYSAVFIGCFALAEAALGKNLLEAFIPKETGVLALIDKEREGARRLQGTFASPLLLAEYATMMIPLIFAYFKDHKSLIAKYIRLGCIGLMLAAIYGSRTRSALGIVAVACCIWGYYFLRDYLADRRNNPVIKCFVAFYGSVIFIGVIAISIWLISALADGYSIAQTLGFSDRGQTLYAGGRDARVIQLEMAIPKIMASPLVGYGLGIGGYIVGFVGTNGMVTLDSYWLLATVDSGLPALLLFICLFGASILKANALTKQDVYQTDKKWLQMIALALGCILLFTTTSPLSDLFPLAFILLGCLMAIRTQKHNSAQ